MRGCGRPSLGCTADAAPASTQAAKSESGQIEIRRSKRHRKRQSLKPFHRHRCTNNSQKNAVHSMPFCLRSAYRLHQVTRPASVSVLRRSLLTIRHLHSREQQFCIHSLFPPSLVSHFDRQYVFCFDRAKCFGEQKLYFWSLRRKYRTKLNNVRIE